MIKKIVVIVTSIILVIILAFTAKNISSNHIMNKKIKAVDSYLKETAKGFGFNGTVLIAKDGKILLNKRFINSFIRHTDYLNDDIMTDKDLLHIGFKRNNPIGLIRLFENKSLKFKLGSKYSYSNSGYILLGYILEKVSGKSYAEYIKENVINKAGMSMANYAPQERIKKMAKPTDVNIYKEQVLKPLPFVNYTLGFSASFHNSYFNIYL